MILQWTIDYPAHTGYEKRNVYAYLPLDYDTSDSCYPVLYMFDGHNVFYDDHATFGKSWGLGKYLDKTNARLIVVALECNHSPMGGRLSEYSPFDFKAPECGFIQGRGDYTMDYFINQLKPDIDARFRTLRDREHTFIAGSSLGGLMSLYAVCKYNNIYSKAAALSPTIAVDMKRIKKFIHNSKLDKNTVIYIDYGTEEFGCKEFSKFDNVEHDYKELNNYLLAHHVCLTSRIVPNGTHSEASWEKQLPFFINTLLYEV